MSNNYLFIKLTFLILLLTAGFSMAQNSIKGAITDTQREPLTGVNVWVQETMEGAITNQKGEFTLTSQLPFPWTVEVSYTGFSTITIKVESAEKDLAIQMEEGITFGQEVVISASRKTEKITQTPSSVTVLSGLKAELLAVPGGDPINLLKNIQGVAIIQHGINKSITSLRGRSTSLNTRALFMKDYRTLNDFYGEVYENERVPVLPIDIERVEVIRGPSGVLWGPGVTAGVVHFISKDPFSYPGLSAEVSYGNSFGDEEKGQAADVTKIDLRYAGHLNNKIGWKLLGSYRTGNDFIYDFTEKEDFGTGRTLAEYAPTEFSGGGAPATRDGQWTDFAGNTLDMYGPNPGTPISEGGGPFNLIPEFSSFNVEGTLEFKPSDKLHFAIVPSYGHSKGNFGNAGVFYYQNVAQFNTQVRATIGKLFASANYRTTPTFNGDMDNGPGWEATYFNAVYRDPGGSQYLDFQAQLPIQIGQSNELIVGADAKTMSRDHVDNFVDGSVNDLKQMGVFSDETYSLVGTYAQYTHQFDEKLKAIAAARVDNWNVYGTAFSPKAALVYSPNNTSSWRLSYNQANTAANFLVSFFQSDVGVRPINGRTVFRAFYGTANPITFDNPTTGLSVGPGINLNNQFTGTDIPLSTILKVVAPDLGVQLSGTSSGSLFTLENEASAAPINNVTQLNAPKKEFETTNSFEIGYKGFIADRLSLSIDFYFNIENNLRTKSIMISPAVAYPNAANDLQNALADHVASGAITQAQADAAVAAAASTFGDKIVGVIVSDQHQELGINNKLTYGFRGYKKAKYFGIDLGSEFYIDAKNSLFLTWAWINKTDFTSEDLNEDPQLNRVFSLNTPGNRIRGGYTFTPGNDKGLFGSVVVQHNGEFQSDFGDFLGTMPPVTTFDAAVGYDFNNGVKLSVSGTNILDADVYGLPFMPRQGRILLATLRFNLLSK